MRDTFLKKLYIGSRTFFRFNNNVLWRLPLPIDPIEYWIGYKDYF